MPLRSDVLESLEALLNEVQREDRTAKVEDLVRQIKDEFPDDDVRRSHIEKAIIDRARERRIPVEFEPR